MKQSEKEYEQLADKASPARPGITAMQWLLAQTGTGERSKEEIDASLREERDW